jgi:hypothetical protein
MTLRHGVIDLHVWKERSPFSGVIPQLQRFEELKCVIARSSDGYSVLMAQAMVGVVISKVRVFASVWSRRVMSLYNLQNKRKMTEK